jgi:crotonobetainyl-CoA:carnitine CoA-transferase CaiB-like acyl-CoA transferase
MSALEGISVLDFTSRLPGPLAGLMLCEAGAAVTKIEPLDGDPLCSSLPNWPDAPTTYAQLNRGKRVLRLDLKAPGDRAKLEPLLHECDVVLEGFRPGVMARLGLDYATLSAQNPRLVYCSLSGYGQAGPDVRRAGHDLTYLAGRGILSLLATRDGEPIVPGVLLADIAAGSYPAFMNIVLALFARERTGRGAYLDVAMAHNLGPFALGGAAGTLFTGGSPRYRMYRTRDGKRLAVAALEPNFWNEFCTRLGLADDLRDDARDPAATAREIERLIAQRDAREWAELLVPFDTCTALLAPLDRNSTPLALPLSPELCH